MTKRTSNQSDPAVSDTQNDPAVSDTQKSADEPTVPVTLRADAWVPDRQKKGETLALPLSVATRLIDEGKAERADPLPGGSA